MSKKDRKNQRKEKNRKNDVSVQDSDSGTGERSPVSDRDAAQKAKKVEMMNRQEEQKFAEIRSLLNRTNGEFPKQERELLQLYIFDDLSQENVAIKLGVSMSEFWKIFDSASGKIHEALPHIKNF